MAGIIKIYCYLKVEMYLQGIYDIRVNRKLGSSPLNYVNSYTESNSKSSFQNFVSSEISLKPKGH